MLWPLASVGGLLFILFMYFLVSSGAGDTGEVLNKDPKQRHKDLLVIGKLQRQIKRERQRDLERFRGFGVTGVWKGRWGRERRLLGRFSL